MYGREDGRGCIKPGAESLQQKAVVGGDQEAQATVSIHVALFGFNHYIRLYTDGRHRAGLQELSVRRRDIWQRMGGVQAFQGISDVP